MSYFIDLLLVGLSIGMVYALVALGISLIYSGLDIVHFAHGELYMFGAFFGLLAFQHVHAPYPVALIAAMVATGVMGIVIERVFYRRLTRAGGGYTVAGMGIIICGFGMSVVLQNIAYLLWNPTPRAFPVDFGDPIQIGGINFPKSYMWIVITALSLMAIMHTFLKHTRWGLAVRAVAHNKDISYIVGINVPLAISLIFGIACAMAAAGGVLIGPINYVQVQMGYLILIKAFAASVVGGFGSLPGAILGGLLVGMTESLGAGYLSVNHKDIYAFALLILVLMVRPSGFLGVIAKVKA